MGVMHIVTPEFPPTPGGVADYARHIAQALSAAGEEVHIWCPSGALRPADAAFDVHGVFARFDAEDFARAGRELDRFPAPRRLFVQWVPHAYGRRSMNLPFCLWLRQRAALGDRIELMVHEPFVTFFEGSWRQTLVAAVHRVMTVVLLRAATRVWVSIPAWESMWKPLAFGRPVPFRWLPVPSGLVRPADEDIAARRAALSSPGRALVGHLGTYGRNVTVLLDAVLPRILRSNPSVDILLAGAGSTEYRDDVRRRHPDLDGRIAATGTLDEAALAVHVAACDILVQPYPDGVSSRRTSAMAALRLGVPLVTTSGYLTEPFWRDAGAVRMHDVRRLTDLADAVGELLCDAAARSRLASAGGDLYGRLFDINLAVDALTARPGKAA